MQYRVLQLCPVYKCTRLSSVLAGELEPIVLRLGLGFLFFVCQYFGCFFLTCDQFVYVIAGSFDVFSVGCHLAASTRAVDCLKRLIVD